MSQTLELQQLQGKSLDELSAYKKAAIARKAELEALKAKGGKDWTSDLQDELDEIAVFLVDVDDLIDEKSVEAAEAAESYKPAEGTADMVHLLLTQGRRFNPNTGKKEAIPFVQMFTFAEWQLFKKNFKGLGFVIEKVLHDPYGDAAEFVTTIE